MATKNQLLEKVPETFKSTYPTKIFCQKLLSLPSQSSLYSNFKHPVTCKLLFGIAPSEEKHLLVSFIQVNSLRTRKCLGKVSF